MKVTAKVARKDENGKRVKEVVDGKKVTVYDEVEKEIKKDKASRLHARRQMLKVLYDVTDVPTARAGKKKNTKKVDMPAKLFDELEMCIRDKYYTDWCLRTDHCLPGSDYCLWTVLSEPSLLRRYFSYHYRRCST